MIPKNVLNYSLDDISVNVSAEVNFIWSIANKLRGTYQSDKYKDVIIPMVVLRRFECALEETKDKVIKKHEENPNYPIKAMYKISGHKFYNISKFTLAELLNDADNLAENLKSYICGFSPAIQTILKNLEFEKQIDKMDKHNRLLGVVKAFSELDLNPKTIDSIKMGYIFEELINKFSENAEAGDHYTGKDIIKLIVSLGLAEGCDDIYELRKVVTVLDQAAGTGGMLSTTHSYIRALNPTADVRLFAQEINPESYAICLAEMLIRGQEIDNICLQDTMKVDCFENVTVRFVFENPPFGQAWGGKDAADGCEEAVLKEASKGKNGRFPAGTPSTGDMQLLFMQAAIQKLEEKGRAVIVSNGSPLFSGNVGSGESQIRRWMLENDYIEAIVQLHPDMFYNTNIATYLWIFSKNKRKERKGKIQLIDATKFCHPLKKSLGKKRYEITPEDREQITKLYVEFKENEFSKIYDNEDFMNFEYTIMQPLQRSYGISQNRIDNLLSNGTLSNLYDDAKVEELENKEELSGKEQAKLENYLKNKPLFDNIIETLTNAINVEIYMSPVAFMPILTTILQDIDIDKKMVEKIAFGLSIMDKNAEIQRDKKGNVIYDKATKDIEIVPYKVNIDDYMEKEVLPHIPDAKAFFEEDLKAKKPIYKIGAEIPFTKCFYKYQAPTSSEELYKKFISLETFTNEQIKGLFGGN